MEIETREETQEGKAGRLWNYDKLNKNDSINLKVNPYFWVKLKLIFSLSSRKSADVGATEDGWSLH